MMKCKDCGRTFLTGDYIIYSHHGCYCADQKNCFEKRKNMSSKRWCKDCELKIATAKNGDAISICNQCSERKTMPNIKITAEVNGKQVPLETISTETFEAIKALKKQKEIPVARLANFGSYPRFIFKPGRDIKLVIGRVYALALDCGGVGADWSLEEEDHWIGRYKNIIPL